MSIDVLSLGGLFTSLRGRILIVAVLLLLALFAMLFANNQRVLQTVAEENIRNNIAQTAETLNLAISPNTTTEGMAVLADYFQELISGGDNGVIYLGLQDDRGTVRAKTHTWPDPLPAVDRELQNLLDHEVVHLEQPILLEGNRVGTLRYGMAWGPLRRSIDRVLWQNVGLASGGLVLLVTILGIVGMRLNERLNRLMDASHALAAGDYSVRAPSEGSDEFADLARGFNGMADAVESRVRELEQSRREINELNEALEERVLLRTEELEQRNGELADTLEHLKRTQENLIQSEKLAGLGSMVAAVSHELNTPIGNALTVATSFADRTRAFQQEIELGLRRSVLEIYQRDSLDAADLVERNLRRAAELIVSFKHVAADQSSSQRRPFDLAQVLEEVVATVRPTFKHTGYLLEVELEEGIAMDSYPGPLGQVVNNLINNALLHGFDGTARGVMRLHGRSRADGRVSLLFSDDGKGIPEEQQVRIFDPFFTTRMGEGGSGLGLHIVHNIVVGLLGGRIEVESRPGQGTRFHLVLPRTAPVSNEPA